MPPRKPPTRWKPMPLPPHLQELVELVQEDIEALFGDSPEARSFRQSWPTTIEMVKPDLRTWTFNYYEHSDVEFPGRVAYGACYRDRKVIRLITIPGGHEMSDRVVMLHEMAHAVMRYRAAHPINPRNKKKTAHHAEWCKLTARWFADPILGGGQEMYDWACKWEGYAMHRKWLKLHRDKFIWTIDDAIAACR